MWAINRMCSLVTAKLNWVFFNKVKIFLKIKKKRCHPKYIMYLRISRLPYPSFSPFFQCRGWPKAVYVWPVFCHWYTLAWCCDSSHHCCDDPGMCLSVQCPATDRHQCDALWLESPPSWWLWSHVHQFCLAQDSKEQAYVKGSRHCHQYEMDLGYRHYKVGGVKVCLL